MGSVRTWDEFWADYLSVLITEIGDGSDLPDDWESHLEYHRVSQAIFGRLTRVWETEIETEKFRRSSNGYRSPINFKN